MAGVLVFTFHWRGGCWPLFRVLATSAHLHIISPLISLSVFFLRIPEEEEEEEENLQKNPQKLF